MARSLEGRLGSRPGEQRRTVGNGAFREAEAGVVEVRGDVGGLLAVDCVVNVALLLAAGKFTK